jgi:hypothetical protein
VTSTPFFLHAAAKSTDCRIQPGVSASPTVISSGATGGGAET